MSNKDLLKVRGGKVEDAQALLAERLGVSGKSEAFKDIGSALKEMREGKGKDAASFVSALQKNPEIFKAMQKKQEDKAEADDPSFRRLGEIAKAVGGVKDAITGGIRVYGHVSTDSNDAVTKDPKKAPGAK